MPWRHQFWMTGSDGCAPGPVVSVERARRQRVVELGTVGGQLGLKIVEHVLRQAAGIRVGLHHQRRHRADEHGFDGAVLAVAGEVMRDFAAAGGVADVHRIAQVEMFDDRGEVVGVVVHVVAVADLCGPAVPAAVMRDDAVAVLKEEQHLGVPVVG